MPTSATCDSLKDLPLTDTTILTVTSVAAGPFVTLGGSVTYHLNVPGAGRGYADDQP